MSDHKEYILTLSCKDTKGIVAEVSGFLAKNDGFIIESAQFGDLSTGRFFMRTVFKHQVKSNKNSYQKLSDKFSKIAKKFSMDWQLYDKSTKCKLLILVSKQSHCLNDILHRYSSGSLNADICGVISNHNDTEEMVKWYGIDFHHLPISEGKKAQQEQKILDIFKNKNANLMVLARYMQVLSPELVKNIYGQAINIHHSFLPGFKGAKPYHQAYDKGVKIIGATAHYVSDDLDEGPIIEQEIIRVNHTHSPQDLLSLGRDIESSVLSRSIKYAIEHRVLVNGNKTVVFN